jgi:hypothetical protein
LDEKKLIKKMKMKKTLGSIFEGRLFKIPDYQRGYAWEEKQWKDFVQDIDELIDDEINSHYTGTIVIFEPNTSLEDYGIEKLRIVEVVDGQQRLTTCSLYLSIIIKELVKIGQEEYKSKIPTYLLSGSKSKLSLNNDTSDFYIDLISKGVSNVEASSVHQKRIYDAYTYLKKQIDNKLKNKADQGEEYLISLYDAIVRKLHFSLYQIDVESEIGMTFELMNSRGKDLSSMELLKNYLMHWAYRNINNRVENNDFTNIINKAWKDVYVNIAKCNGSENQCLRIAWTLLINATPKKWKGYVGFKSEEVIPLRNFTEKTKEEVHDFILRFVDKLALISKHYATIIKPNNTFDEKELNLLTKIRNAGNIANFLPLMVASRIKRENNEVDNEEYLEFLKAIEKFSYRVFLWEGKRSNSGLSKFYRWADDVLMSKHTLNDVTDWIYASINWYSPEHSFRKSLKEDVFQWYHQKRLLKYTLFEYELFLLDGKNKPKLNWSDLTDSTIEHILPQNPNKNSTWLTKWTEEERKTFLHDISNLVLTKDNSSYSNFEFDRKKGIAGSKPSYSDSDIKQERKISEYEDWTPEQCNKRREELTNWIITNWGIDKHVQQLILDGIDEDEEEELMSHDID